MNSVPQPRKPTIGEIDYATKLKAYEDWSQYVSISTASNNNIILFK